MDCQKWAVGPGGTDEKIAAISAITEGEALARAEPGDQRSQARCELELEVPLQHRFAKGRDPRGL